MKGRAGNRFRFRPELVERLRGAGSTGLTEAVLQGIRTDVFNVSAPIGP
jgi:hypothetical protein